VGPGGGGGGVWGRRGMVGEIIMVRCGIMMRRRAKKRGKWLEEE
jgi:hypothetical protein